MRVQGTSIINAIVLHVPEFGIHVAHDREWFESNIYIASAAFFDFAKEAAKQSNAELVTRIYTFADPYFAKQDGDSYGDAMWIEMLEPILTCGRPPSDHIKLLYTCLGPNGKAIVDSNSNAFQMPRVF